MFKNFYENEDFQKENILTNDEITLLKGAGFKTSKDHKTASKHISKDFVIDVNSDKEFSKLILKIISTDPEIEIASSKYHYLTKKAIDAFIFYSEAMAQSAERLKNL